MTAATEQALLIAAVAALFSAAVTDLLLRHAGRPTRTPISLLLTVATTLLAFTVTVRWIREQQGPFLTLYDVLLSNLFTLTLIFLVGYLLKPAIRITTVVVLPLFVLLGLWMLTLPADAVPLPPTFDNGWLWLHVASGKVFLGLCLIAAATSALLAFAHFNLVGSHLAASIQSRKLDSTIWPVFALAFVCHSFMLIAGAVWADGAWGHYWTWDPLETWALVTWLAMGLLLHARVTYPKMPLQAAWVSVVGIFLLAFLTFFGVPFVSLAPHKGIM